MHEGLRRRPAAAALAISAVLVTLSVGMTLRPVPLAEVLLIVLVEVIGVSLVAPKGVAAATAVGSALAVNWLLVPPYGTLRIAEQQNWITLAIFLLLAVGASTLVQVVVDSERRAAAGRAREAALAEVLNPDQASASTALGTLVLALDLTGARITDPSGQHVLTWGQQVTVNEATLSIEVAPGFRVLGWGDPRLGQKDDHVETLAIAAVRAWESQRLLDAQLQTDRLQEVDRARSALLASIGHDLRTPLTAIRVSADALALVASGGDPRESASLVTALQDSALRLDELLEGLLDAARFEAGIASPRLEYRDLRPTLERVVTDLASPRLQLDLPRVPLAARVDHVLLERVLANLVSNGLAHTPDDSTVEVRARSSTRGPVIFVIDHGPGLDPGADAAEPRSGMGLAIVGQLAKVAGIGLSQRQTLGGGVTITLEPGGAADVPDVPLDDAGPSR
jgi:two-component system, OmpR family, sensor histidine kinase KdpD